MSTKVRAMIQAITNGIKQVKVLHAANGSLLLEDETIGTVIKAAHRATGKAPAVSRAKRREILHERAG